jgi:hypothetical protein
MAPLVSRYLARRGFTRQASELQFYEQRIDVYGYSARRDLAVAIELKLEKWKRAVDQGLLYQLCADLVFLAMPEASIRRVPAEILREHGLGLIAISDAGRCRVAIDAAQSTLVHAKYKADYAQLLSGGKKCRRDRRPS